MHTGEARLIVTSGGTYVIALLADATLTALAVPTTLAVLTALPSPSDDCHHNLAIEDFRDPTAAGIGQMTPIQWGSRPRRWAMCFADAPCPMRFDVLGDLGRDHDGGHVNDRRTRGRRPPRTP